VKKIFKTNGMHGDFDTEEAAWENPDGSHGWSFFACTPIPEWRVTARLSGTAATLHECILQIEDAKALVLARLEAASQVT
jgi:hypothetical protein